MTNHRASLNSLRNFKDMQLARAFRPTNRQDSWIAGPSDSQQRDCPASSRQGDMELEPIPISRDNLSNICAWLSIHESHARHDPTLNKIGTMTLVGTRRTFDPLDSTATWQSDYLHDRENFLSFTNVPDILDVGDEYLNDEPYQVAKLPLPRSVNWSRLATTLIYLGEIPVITGWKELARYYPASPQSAHHDQDASHTNMATTWSFEANIRASAERAGNKLPAIECTQARRPLRYPDKTPPVTTFTLYHRAERSTNSLATKRHLIERGPEATNAHISQLTAPASASMETSVHSCCQYGSSARPNDPTHLKLANSQTQRTTNM